MKKILMLFTIILTLLINTKITYAKTVNDVACTYSVKNPIGNEMTTIQIQILGYNDGAGGSIAILYKDQSGNYTTYSSPTYSWQNYGKTDAYSQAMLRIFTTDKKGSTFISNYKTSGKCPTIYSNVTSDGSTIDVENHVLEPTDPTGTSKALGVSAEYLRTTGGSWETPTNFFKNESGESSVKEDLVCNYDMEFDMYNIKTPVEFRTIYNPTNGSKTYRISVNGNGQTYNDLNNDVGLSLGQGGSGIVYITSTQLKKIFKEDSCYERSQVYHYYDQASGRYIITTDRNEASENGTAGRYDNGDGSNDGSGGITAPDMDISKEKLSCSELLGTGATALIKLFITGVRIVAVIIAVVIAMLNFIPPIMNGNPDGELKKAFKKTTKLLVVLAIVVSFPNILNLIGKLFDFDLSCIF